MSINYVFERIEKKYLLTKDDYQILFNALLSFIEPDQFFSSTVSSLYLDTPDQLIIRNSIDADNYKEKIRLRSYGPANDDTTVFLELKKKLNGIVYKRRVSMSLQDAELYIDKGIMPFHSQIISEIDYALRYYHNPKPKMFIACEREAWKSTDDPGLRFTFDKSIRYRSTNLSLGLGSNGIELIPEYYALMEIKIPGSMPLWLTHILCDLNIYPVSFSKYGSAYKLTNMKLGEIQSNLYNNSKGVLKNVINF